MSEGKFRHLACNQKKLNDFRHEPSLSATRTIQPVEIAV